jgi:hypothetical protein
MRLTTSDFASSHRLGRRVVLRDGDEVGEGFKRHSEMTAAKRVAEEHFDNREDD